MRRCLLVISAILFATAFAAGQDAKPQPTPPDDVVKITTNLIQVDVTVTDSKGKPVTDLKPEEIEIYENGEKQKLTHFSFVSSVRERVGKDSEPDKNAIPMPPTVINTANIHRTIALVVDDLSLSFESAYYTRRVLKKFVDEQIQEGDLVSIIRTGAGIGALQQFTSDKRMLYAAIERVKWNPLGSGGIGAFAPIESQLPSSGKETNIDYESANDGQSLEDFRNTTFVTGTLGALRYIVAGMGELPGRKSVILFSDGFALYEKDGTVLYQTGRVLDYLRPLIDQANRMSVVIYTVDPRGVVPTGFTAIDNTSGMTIEHMNQALTGRSARLIDTQQGPSYLARETGGFDIKNNNDLSGGVRKILDDQSYYLVGYDPDTDSFDPVKRRFNKLEVKVLRKDVKVRYRSGFFNFADRERPGETNVSATSTQPAGAQLVKAIVSPFAVSGINLKLNALFGSDAKNGAFVRSILHVDTSEMKFTDEPNGEKKVAFDVMAISFGDNGQVVDQLGKTYTLTLKPDAYKKIAESGFVYHFMFPVKKPGAYQYRVALRDTQGGRIGSASQFIEVPNLKKKRLSLSSIVIENLSEKDWNLKNSASSAQVDSDPMKDTALRRVKLGSVLRYGFEVYNAKLDGVKLPKLNARIRVFRDGKVILDGEQKPLDVKGQTEMAHIKSSGAIAIGSQMQAGDYILQLIVTDELADKKKQIVTQFIQFEVVQ